MSVFQPKPVGSVGFFVLSSPQLPRPAAAFGLRLGGGLGDLVQQSVYAVLAIATRLLHCRGTLSRCVVVNDGVCHLPGKKLRQCVLLDGDLVTLQMRQILAVEDVSMPVHHGHMQFIQSPVGVEAGGGQHFVVIADEFGCPLLDFLTEQAAASPVQPQLDSISLLKAPMDEGQSSWDRDRNEYQDDDEGCHGRVNSENSSIDGHDRRGENLRDHDE